MSKIVQTVLVVILAIVGYVIYDYYSLLSLPSLFENFQQSDLSSCTRLSEAKGCEDLLLDQKSGIAIIGCPTPFGTFSTKFVKTGIQKSNVFAYNLNTKKLTELQLKNYPKDLDLLLHGMDQIPNSDSSDKINFIAINHHNNGTDSVESFQYKIGSSDLTHIKTFKNPGFHSLNGITAVDSQSFYYTQYFSKSNQVFQFLEVVGALRGGKVFHYDGKTDTLTQATPRTYKQPNGIAFNKDRSQIFLGETATAKIHIYDINDDFTLEPADSVQLSVLPDNIKIDEESGDFYIAGFPISFEVINALNTFNTPKFVPCKSSIIKLSKELGEARFFGTKYKTESVVMDSGEELFSTSVGVYHRKTNSIIMAGFLNEKGAMHCPL